MPIYEYDCAKCGAHFERLVKSFTDKSRAKCPDCGSKKVEKAFSLFSSGRSSRSSGSDSASCSSCARSSCAGCTR